MSHVSLTFGSPGVLCDAPSANTPPSDKEPEEGCNVTLIVSSFGSLTFDALPVTDVTSSSLVKSVSCWTESAC